MLPSQKKIRSRSNNVQLNMLVDYMQAHKLFANGEYAGPLGNQKMQQQWEELRIILSEHGPDKTVEQWKHTWRDLKKRSREEGSRIRQAREKTGNSSFVPSISEMSSKVLGIIGKECAFGIGDPGETAIGSFLSQPRPNVTGTGMGSFMSQQHTNNYTATATSAADSNACGTIVPHCTSSRSTESCRVEFVYAEQVAEQPIASSAPVRRPEPPPQVARAPTPHQTPEPAQSRAHIVQGPTQSQQRRTGLGGRADGFLAAEHENNNILKEILNTMQAGLLQKRMKYRQMLRQARTRHFK